MPHTATYSFTPFGAFNASIRSGPFSYYFIINVKKLQFIHMLMATDLRKQQK